MTITEIKRIITQIATDYCGIAADGDFFDVYSRECWEGMWDCDCPDCDFIVWFRLYGTITFKDGTSEKVKQVLQPWVEKALTTVFRY